MKTWKPIRFDPGCATLGQFEGAGSLFVISAFIDSGHFQSSQSALFFIVTFVF